MIRLEVKGLDTAPKRLEQLKQKAQSLAGKREIPVNELFTSDFMRRHSKLSSFEALIEAGGHHVKSQEDFQAIPDAVWERTIRAHTSFSSWHEMQVSAAREHYADRLKA